MSCDHECPRPTRFPAEVFNRPGLSTIGRRIGTFTAIYAHMLRRLDRPQSLALGEVERRRIYGEMSTELESLLAAAGESPLAAWTHRQPDDPGIALLGAAARVADILTFYQDLYANEAFLRTAKWLESVTDLVRLAGYRPAPGVGGEARFALTAKGSDAITVPASTRIEAQLEQTGQKASFETGEEHTVWPHLGEFRLYRPRWTPPVGNGAQVLQVVWPEGEGTAPRPDEQLLVGVPVSLETGGEALENVQIVAVDEVREEFGATLVRLKTPFEGFGPSRSSIVSAFSPERRAVVSPAASAATSVRVSRSALTAVTSPAASLAGSSATWFPGSGGLGGLLSILETLLRPPAERISHGEETAPGETDPSTRERARELRAYRLAGSFRHFGHNAPVETVEVDDTGAVTNLETDFVRPLGASTTSCDPSLPGTWMPLDGERDSVTAGAAVLVEVELSAEEEGVPSRRSWLVRTIQGVQARTVTWGAVSGASSVVRLDRSLSVTYAGTGYRYADIRSVSLHVADGEPFLLRAEPEPTRATRGIALDFLGTADEVSALGGREIALVDEAGVVSLRTVSSVEAGSGEDAQISRLRRVNLDSEVDYASFDHDAPTVTVYGNLAAATEGRTEAATVLGDGDARAVFQTFELPKSPLTWFLDPEDVSGRSPELTVWVDGLAWKRVDSLYLAGPRDHVYVVRQDTEGVSYVQFGDGVSGARLPSGRRNVSAGYRTGVGGRGAVAAGARPKIAGSVPGVDQVRLIGDVTGGADAESEDISRRAAPGRMQSLGRIVSLADFESEVLALPGVLKATATWADRSGASAIRIVVLLEEETADPAGWAAVIREFTASRGAVRRPVEIVVGTRQPVRIALDVSILSGYREEDVTSGILSALGAAGRESEGIDASQGLLGWRRRAFGQGLHGSQVLAAVQGVPGVAWTGLRALGAPGRVRFFARVRSDLQRRPAPPAQHQVVCPMTRILSLQADDLVLTLGSDEDGG